MQKRPLAFDEGTEKSGCTCCGSEAARGDGRRAQVLVGDKGSVFELYSAAYAKSLPDMSKRFPCAHTS